MNKLTGQKLVDAIYQRAKTTNYGCGEPEQSLTIKDNYASDSVEHIALMVVGAFHSKYDLVAILQATIEVLSENGTTNLPELIRNVKHLNNDDLSTLYTAVEREMLERGAGDE